MVRRFCPDKAIFAVHFFHPAPNAAQTQRQSIVFIVFLQNTAIGTTIAYKYHNYKCDFLDLSFLDLEFFRLMATSSTYFFPDTASSTAARTQAQDTTRAAQKGQAQRDQHAHAQDKDRFSKALDHALSKKTARIEDNRQHSEAHLRDDNAKRADDLKQESRQNAKQAQQARTDAAHEAQEQRAEQAERSARKKALAEKDRQETAQEKAQEKARHNDTHNQEEAVHASSSAIAQQNKPALPGAPVDQSEAQNILATDVDPAATANGLEAGSEVTDPSQPPSSPGPLSPESNSSEANSESEANGANPDTQAEDIALLSTSSATANTNANNADSLSTPAQAGAAHQAAQNSTPGAQANNAPENSAKAGSSTQTETPQQGNINNGAHETAPKNGPAETAQKQGAAASDENYLSAQQNGDKNRSDLKERLANIQSSELKQAETAALKSALQSGNTKQGETAGQNSAPPPGLAQNNANSFITAARAQTSYGNTALISPHQDGGAAANGAQNANNSAQNTLTATGPNAGPNGSQAILTAAPQGPASTSAPMQTSAPVQSLAVQIGRQFQNGNHKFTIRMDPPELGRIDVKLDVGKDGTVQTHMVVERSETLDLLQRDARQLERALADAGLEQNDGGVTFSLQDQTNGGEHAAQNSESGGDKNDPSNPATTQTQQDDDDASAQPYYIRNAAYDLRV